MVYCCSDLSHEYTPLTIPLSKWLTAQKEPPKDQFKDEMEDVLRTMWVIGSDDQHNEAFVKIANKVAPLEFIFIGTLSKNQHTDLN